MEMGIKGRVALVTDIGGGIGGPIALALAAEGCRLALNDLEGDAASLVAAVVAGQGGEAQSFNADFTDSVAAAGLIQAVAERFGRLDILVNSAGILHRKAILSSTPEEWARVLAINLSSIFYCSQPAGRLMARQGWGRIINITSGSAFKGVGNSGSALYATSRAAANCFTRGMAKELGPHGVTVNALAPTTMRIPLTAGLVDDAFLENLKKKIPVGRICQPEDLAATVVFLASPSASFINGVTLPLDGGSL